jgi:hypothetical protein
MNAGTPIGLIVALVAVCLVLLVIGLMLRRRGMLRSRGAALAWAILTIAPLFGSGAILYGKHQIERANGQENSQLVPSSGPIPN